MFPIFLKNSDQMPDKKICYIIGKDGIYLKKKIGIFESVVPVNSISHLKEVQCYAKVNIKKIPLKMFFQICSFFKKVNELYNAESVVLLCYNATKRKYKVIVPDQEVSGGSIKYDILNSYKESYSNDFDLIGTIHSHNTFGSFHSSVDTEDEKNIDGIHITVGNVNRNKVSISASVMVNGTRFKTSPKDHINSIVEGTELEESSFRSGYFHKVSVHRKFYYVEEEKFPKKWLDKVSVQKEEVIIIPNRYNDFMVFDRFLDWSDKYDYPSNYIKNNVEEHETNEDVCKTCKYRRQKLNLLAEEDQDFLNDVIDLYESIFQYDDLDDQLAFKYNSEDV